MHIKPSTSLRNEYLQISELANKPGEPIFITNKGEGDLVLMSIESYEARERMYRERDKVYAAEFARINNLPSYSIDDVFNELEILYGTK